MRRALRAAFLAALAAAGCDRGAPATPAPAAPSAPTPETGPVAPKFVDVSEGSGLDLVNVNGDQATKPTILESLGQGAAVLDYDGDGDLDVFVCNGDVLNGKPAGAAPRCALYRQEAPFRFADVSAAAGVALRGWYQGAYAADVDADGDPDLLLTAWGGTKLLRNRGDGTFEDATRALGLEIGGWTSGAAFLDADGDGDLDVYVARYVTLDPAKPPNDGKPCEWKGLLVACGPHGLPAEPDVLMENVGGTFVDATAKFGIDAAKPSYGLGVVAFDFDGDGDQDVCVANDSVANFLWENRGGRFVDVAGELGTDLGEGGRAQAGMGVDAGDVDGDGRPDLVVTNFDEDVDSLYLNLCDGRLRAFFNATAGSGLGPPSFRRLAWGVRIFDADGDGRNDVAIADGHIYPQVDRSGVDATFAQRNRLHMNVGATREGLPRLVVADDAGSFFAKKASSRGLLTADFDDDLDLDLLVVEMDAKPTLGRNDAPEGRGRLGVRLVGAGKNRDALGAVLVWEDDRGTTRKLDRTFGGGFYSTSDPRLVATWGGARLRSARVRFASGAEVAIDPNLAGGYVVVDEATLTARPATKGAR